MDAALPSPGPAPSDGWRGPGCCPPTGSCCQRQGSPCTHTSPPCPEAGRTMVAETGASWAPWGGSLPFAQCWPPGKGPPRTPSMVAAPQLLFTGSLACSLHLPRAGGWGGRSSGLPPPASCTPSGPPPGLHAPNLSLSYRLNIGCATGPTGSVCPRQPRSARRKLSRWAWARGGARASFAG